MHVKWAEMSNHQFVCKLAKNKPGMQSGKLTLGKPLQTPHCFFVVFSIVNHIWTTLSFWLSDQVSSPIDILLPLSGIRKTTDVFVFIYYYSTTFTAPHPPWLLLTIEDGYLERYIYTGWIKSDLKEWDGLQWNVDPRDSLFLSALYVEQC